MITPEFKIEKKIEDSPGLVAALEQYKQLSVKNGILQGAGKHPNSDASFANIAAYNELGTKRIPSRPFMRTAYLRLMRFHRAEIKRFLLGSLVAKGRLRKRPMVKEFFGACGEKIKGLMVRNIEYSKILFVPNAETTITMKGSDQPLFDTGLTRAALSYEVTK